MPRRLDGARLTPPSREGDGGVMSVSRTTTPSPSPAPAPEPTDTPRASPAKNGQQSVSLPPGHRARLAAFLETGHVLSEVVAATGHTVSEASVRRARDGDRLLRASIQVICHAVDTLAPALGAPAPTARPVT